MEAEYVVLSQCMRDLIPIQEILKEIMLLLFKVEHNPKCATYSKAFRDTEEPQGFHPVPSLRRMQHASKMP
jgi:hypothetical protein